MHLKRSGKTELIHRIYRNKTGWKLGKRHKIPLHSVKMGHNLRLFSCFYLTLLKYPPKSSEKTRSNRIASEYSKKILEIPCSRGIFVIYHYLYLPESLPTLRLVLTSIYLRMFFMVRGFLVDTVCHAAPIFALFISLGVILNEKLALLLRMRDL